MTDVNPAALDWVRANHPGVRVVDSTDELLAADLDVYAPCALGGALDDAAVATLTASVVCGAANNQLAHPGIDKALAERGVLYAPDYLVNAGGVIQVGDEAAHLHEGGFSFERAKNRAERIFDTTLEILRRSKADGVPPAATADRLAEERMRSVARLRGILLPAKDALKSVMRRPVRHAGRRPRGGIDHPRTWHVSSTEVSSLCGERSFGPPPYRFGAEPGTFSCVTGPAIPT